MILQQKNITSIISFFGDGVIINRIMTYYRLTCHFDHGVICIFELPKESMTHPVSLRGGGRWCIME